MIHKRLVAIIRACGAEEFDRRSRLIRDAEQRRRQQARETLNQLRAADRDKEPVGARGGAG